jgi:hypothetical protein
MIIEKINPDFSLILLDLIRRRFKKKFLQQFFQSRISLKNIDFEDIINLYKNIYIEDID